MRWRLALLAVLALAAARLAASQPAYASQLFEVYDHAGAGSEYAAAVATALEEAYAAFKGSGVALAPPCSGPRYAVHVVELAGGEGGLVRWQLTSEGGLVKGACVVWVNITKGLDAQQLKHVAYHEVAHIAQAAYYRYEAVALAYPWYVEASAEGLASALSGVCGWEPQYFSYKLYGYNPYSFSGPSSQSYALSAFYYWVAGSGYASPRDALSGSLSGASVVSDWVNEAYASFLLALARGLEVCGSRYAPSFVDVYLPRGSWSAEVKLDGLSAAYFRVSVPAPGPVLIAAPGGLRSNLLLNRPFRTENTTLLLALVNPSLNPVSGTVTVSYTPPFEAALAGGVFDPASGRLEVVLRLLFAGQPVEGTVYVNGTAVEASSGYARAALSAPGWGSYTVAVHYLGETAYVKVRVAQPAAELETATPLYLSGSGRGELVVRLRNAGDVAVKLRAGAVAPPFLRVAQLELEAPPGESRLNLSFSVVGPVEAAGGEVRLSLGPSSLALPFSVVPSNLTVLEASYDAGANATSVAAAVEPLGLRLTARVQGLSGDAWFKLSTYYVGRASVSLPPPRVNLSAKPILVAPSWVLLAVNATVSAGGACPAYPASYRVPVAVNGTPLGTASLRCGELAALGALLNATYGPRAAVVLAERAGAALEVPVPLPELEARAVDWLLSDEGGRVRVEVSVRGPCRYLVMGRELANSTLVLEERLGAGAAELVVDTGFGRFALSAPPTSLELEAPRVADARKPLKLAVVLRTQARVNASAQLLLNGTPAAEVRLAKGAGGWARYELEVQPPGPALYNVTVRAWFASASASVAYVLARGLELAAPPFALLNRSAEVRVALRAEPPLKLPVNVTVEGCGRSSFQVEANSSFTLSYAEPCTARVLASFLDLTARAEIRWDALSLIPERYLGALRGGFVVPNGTISFTARFSNGSPAPAKVEVEGLPSFTARKPGSYALRVRAEYAGQVNETLVTVYAVPEALYRRALSALAELGEAPHLKGALERAVVSGEWGKVEEFANAYELAGARARYGLPAALIAKRLAERWAAAGDEGALSAAETLLAVEIPLYLAAAALAAALIRRRARRGSPNK
jgi:hypothetical protein